MKIYYRNDPVKYDLACPIAIQLIYVYETQKMSGMVTGSTTYTPNLQL
ncbi:hypothetical protein BDFB_012774 [Asbolus verrucosus]|uniref:Uncharacterized protein n=1 Tax=Asbolus verrucosus TaxID=1661398 RepID=A0A482VYD2_ASBVE|nr:hypothetical protein BDFB_012774 [Asbolus verrucosus]